MTDRQRMMTIGSFAISVLLFWVMLGSVYTALAVLVLLLIHEMGHFWAAKHVGLSVEPPIFTPFGAFIQLLEQPKDAAEEAFVAYAGPLLGTIGAIGSLVLGVMFGVPTLIIAAKFAFFLNLFNLIPLAPLDGGRISMALHRKMWVLGVLAFAYLIFAQGINFLLSPINLIVFFLIGQQAIQDIQMREIMAREIPQYFDVPLTVRVVYGALYAALGAFLLFAFTNMPTLISLLQRLGL